MTYKTGDARYALDAFAAVEMPEADSGVVFVRFGVATVDSGRVAAIVGYDAPVTAESGRLANEKGETLVLFDASWTWDSPSKKLVANLSRGKAAGLAIFTQPRAQTPPPLTDAVYARQRDACAHVWQSFLDAGATLDVPEAVVMDAWRSLMIGNSILMRDDVLNYSASNLYDRQFEAECGDAVSAMAMFGQKDDARRAIVPLLSYTQENLDYHDAAFKLQMLAHYYSLARDADFVRSQRTHWERELAFILKNRNADNGLLPREAYCGDISTPVFSLNSNANCWRALRDWAWITEELGETTRSAELRREANAFRESILAAVAKSERRDFQPPFMPMAPSESTSSAP
jgi:hypothetical protein